MSLLMFPHTFWQLPVEKHKFSIYKFLLYNFFNWNSTDFNGFLKLLSIQNRRPGQRRTQNVCGGGCTKRPVPNHSVLFDNLILPFSLIFPFFKLQMKWKSYIYPWSTHSLIFPYNAPHPQIVPVFQACFSYNWRVMYSPPPHASTHNTPPPPGDNATSRGRGGQRIDSYHISNPI